MKSMTLCFAPFTFPLYPFTFYWPRKSLRPIRRIFPPGWSMPPRWPRSFSSSSRSSTTSSAVLRSNRNSKKLLRQLRTELNQLRHEQGTHLSEVRGRVEGAHQRVDLLTHDLNNKLQRLPGEIVDILHKTGVLNRRDEPVYGINKLNITE